MVRQLYAPVRDIYGEYLMVLLKCLILAIFQHTGIVSKTKGYLGALEFIA